VSAPTNEDTSVGLTELWGWLSADNHWVVLILAVVAVVVVKTWFKD